MVKGRGKAKVQLDGRVKEKALPIVTSDVCEKCEIQCPAGISYMEKMRTGNKIGYGVPCRKGMYIERIKKDLPPFENIFNLIKQN